MTDAPVTDAPDAPGAPGPYDYRPDDGPWWLLSAFVALVLGAFLFGCAPS